MIIMTIAFFDMKQQLAVKKRGTGEILYYIYGKEK